MNYSIFTGNILLHVGLMSLFLTFFFFTFARQVEKEIVEEQIKYIIDNFVGNSFNVLDIKSKTQIKEQLDKIFESLNFTKEDTAVKNQNSIIFKKALVFVSILFGIILFIVILLGIYFKWDSSFIKYLLISSISSLIFVAITETMFLLLIAKNYLSADPNRIKRKIVDSLFNNRCNPGEKNCLGTL